MDAEFLHTWTATDYGFAAIGLVLLLFGRKVYWLALGGVGVLAGLWISENYLRLASPEARLLAMVVLGILGAVLAVIAQKVAVLVGGFLVGGAAAVWIGDLLQANLDSGLWLGIILASAVVGGFLGAVVFEIMLTLLSAWIGAGLIVQALHLEYPRNIVTFVVLLLVGLVVQSRRRKARVRMRPRAD